VIKILRMESDVTCLQPLEDRIFIPTSSRPSIEEKCNEITFFFRVTMDWIDWQKGVLPATSCLSIKGNDRERELAKTYIEALYLSGPGYKEQPVEVPSFLFGLLSAPPVLRSISRMSSACVQVIFTGHGQPNILWIVGTEINVTVAESMICNIICEAQRGNNDPRPIPPTLPNFVRANETRLRWNASEIETSFELIPLKVQEEIVKWMRDDLFDLGFPVISDYPAKLIEASPVSFAGPVTSTGPVSSSNPLPTRSSPSPISSLSVSLSEAKIRSSGPSSNQTAFGGGHGSLPTFDTAIFGLTGSYQPLGEGSRPSPCLITLDDDVVMSSPFSTPGRPSPAASALPSTSASSTAMSTTSPPKSPPSTTSRKVAIRSPSNSGKSPSSNLPSVQVRKCLPATLDRFTKGSQTCHGLPPGSNNLPSAYLASLDRNDGGDTLEAAKINAVRRMEILRPAMQNPPPHPLISSTPSMEDTTILDSPAISPRPPNSKKIRGASNFMDEVPEISYPPNNSDRYNSNNLNNPSDVYKQTVVVDNSLVTRKVKIIKRKESEDDWMDGLTDEQVDIILSDAEKENVPVMLPPARPHQMEPPKSTINFGDRPLGCPPDMGQAGWQVERSLSRDRVDDDPYLVPFSSPRAIIIDGSNVAFNYGGGGPTNKIFHCRGIRIAVDYFKKRGHQRVTVFVPQWRQATQSPHNNIIDHHILNQLEEEGILKFTPCRRENNVTMNSYDDRYIVQAAVQTRGIILSNDKFRDLIRESREKEEAIMNRLLPYMFMEDELMPPEDPLGKHGPRLDEFLTIFREEMMQYRRSRPPDATTQVPISSSSDTSVIPQRSASENTIFRAELLTLFSANIIQIDEVLEKNPEERDLNKLANLVVQSLPY